VIPVDVWQWLARAFFVWLFGLSVVSKVRRPRSFAQGVADYGVPRRLVRILAPAVVGAETALVAGFLFIDGFAPWVGAFLILGVFSAAQAWSWARGAEHACHCFGADEAIGPMSIGRSLVLALLALATVALAPRPDALVGTLGSPIELLGLVVWAMLLAGLIARPHDAARIVRRATRN
jgi:uncharacterized membrane protein YphA (DoxX/SURF4 family)